jgi:hypothetical protein
VNDETGATINGLGTKNEINLPVRPSRRARVSVYSVGAATEIGCSVNMRDEEMVSD